MPNDMSAAREAKKQQEQFKETTIDFDKVWFVATQDNIELNARGLVVYLNFHDAVKLRNFLSVWSNAKRTRDNRKIRNENKS